MFSRMNMSIEKIDQSGGIKENEEALREAFQKQLYYDR